MTRKNRGVLGQDVSSEGFGPKVKDTARTVIGKPLKQSTGDSSRTVIGKIDRKGSGDEVDRMVSIMEKDGVGKSNAMAQVFDKSLGLPEPGEGRRAHHGVVKGR